MKWILYSGLLSLMLGSCNKHEIESKPSDQYHMFTEDVPGAGFPILVPFIIIPMREQKIISGWVKGDGTIEAGALTLDSDSIETKTLYSKLEFDDHDNPAFVECSDGSVFGLYTKHSKRSFYQNKTNKQGDVLSFSSGTEISIIDSTELLKFPRKPSPMRIPLALKRKNGRIYCFGRWTGFKPNMMWSDDMGETWSKAKVFITNFPFDPGNRPYVKYFSDGKSKIHILFTEGHPRNEPTNSVYYAYYEKGAYYKAGGEKICDLNDIPFEPKQASLVYMATPETGKAWIFDIASDAHENPVIAYTRYPTDEDHRYHYAIFKNGKWIDHEICSAGKWFPQTIEGETEREPNYSAGLILDPVNTNMVYLSRPVNDVFEIEKRVTRDNGKTWKVIPITSGSSFDNVRPMIPRNKKQDDPAVLIWMENEPYVHYTNFKVSIRYMVEN